MRIIFFIFGCLGCLASKAQNGYKEIKIDEVGWTLSIPIQSAILDSAQFDTIKKHTADILTDTYGSDLGYGEMKPLFAARQGKYNVIGSTITRYDSSLFKTWQESYVAYKEAIITLINDQEPGILLIDTATAVEQIDGLIFQRLYLKTYYPSMNLTLHSYWFCQKRGSYDFSINIAYSDEIIGAQYLDLLRKSRFTK